MDEKKGTELLDRAIEFAVKSHSGVYRKGRMIPYILHPMEAAAVAATMTEDVHVLAACVLHDVVEDTPCTVEDLRAMFGDRVAELVDAVSENKRAHLAAAETWLVRKQETLEHLKTAERDVKIMTLGDKLSNIRSLHLDRLERRETMWDCFNQKDPAMHRWYYASLAEALSELKDCAAWQEYNELVNLVFEGVEEIDVKPLV